MRTILRTLRIAGGLIAALGIVAGPLLIAGSAYFFSRLNDFRENGTTTTGIVTAKYDNGGYGRERVLFIDVRYRVAGSSAEQFAERFNPSKGVQRRLRIGQEVDMYYKNNGDPSDILLAADYYPENIPPAYQPYTGWIVTLYSLGYILAYQLYKRRKKKQHERHA